MKVRFDHQEWGPLILLPVGLAMIWLGRKVWPT